MSQGPVLPRAALLAPIGPVREPGSVQPAAASGRNDAPAGRLSLDERDREAGGATDHTPRSGGRASGDGRAIAPIPVEPPVAVFTGEGSSVLPLVLAPLTDPRVLVTYWETASGGQKVAAAMATAALTALSLMVAAVVVQRGRREGG